MSSDQRIEPGTCTACGRPAERGPSGAWWHTGTACGRIAPRATFRARHTHRPPRDRQVRDLRRDR